MKTMQKQSSGPSSEAKIGVENGANLFRMYLKYRLFTLFFVSAKHKT
jgi:hypothetical protein